jgi:hypothetical protein
MYPGGAIAAPLGALPMARDLAPGWQIRCTHCGRSKPLAAVGGIRLGAFSIGKRTIAWCSNCRRLRIAAIERVPTAGAAATAGSKEWI